MPILGSIELPEFDTVYGMAVAFQAFHVCVWFYTWMWPNKDPKMNEWKYHGSKAPYYLFMSMAQLKILANAPFLPTILGGTGGLDDGQLGSVFTTGVWRSIEYRNAMTPLTSSRFQQVYFAEIFYHSFSSFTSILPNNRTKPEMFLHHIVTMMLLFVSYHADHCPEGTIILLLHNAPDIWTSLAKCLYALNMKYEVFATYLCLLATWVFFRLILLANYAHSVISNPGSTVMFYCGSGLWILFCMHVFWFYLFLGMGAKFIKKGGKSLPTDTTQHDHKKVDADNEPSTGGERRSKRKTAK